MRQGSNTVLWSFLSSVQAQKRKQLINFKRKLLIESSNFHIIISLLSRGKVNARHGVWHYLISWGSACVVVLFTHNSRERERVCVCVCVLWLLLFFFLLHVKYPSQPEETFFACLCVTSQATFRGQDIVSNLKWSRLLKKCSVLFCCSG